MKNPLQGEVLENMEFSCTTKDDRKYKSKRIYGSRADHTLGRHGIIERVQEHVGDVKKRQEDAGQSLCGAH